MLSVALILFLSFVGIATAQDSTPSSSASPGLVETGSGSTVATHVVTVGKGLKNAFSPDSLTANKGDIIQFQFFPPNHSVGRAEFKQPCIPYEDTGEHKVGFWSGFYPLDTIPENPPTWNVTINDTEPVFLYCAAPGSCINNQMVAVINPDSANALDIQKQDAKSSSYMLAPGEPFPSEEGVPAGDVDPTRNATGPGGSNGSSKGSSHGLSGGAIAGIAIAGVVVAVLVGAVFFLLGRNRSLLQFMKGNHYRAPGPQIPPGDQAYPSPNPNMSAFPTAAAAVPYTGHQTYQQPLYDSPPYTEYASHSQSAPPPTSPSVIAELPSPRNEKPLHTYTEMDHPASRAPYQDNPAPMPSPTSQSRSSIFWGRSRSTKTKTSELAAEAPPERQK